MCSHSSPRARTEPARNLFVVFSSFRKKIIILRFFLFDQNTKTPQICGGLWAGSGRALYGLWASCGAPRARHIFTTFMISILWLLSKLAPCYPLFCRYILSTLSHIVSILSTCTQSTVRICLIHSAYTQHTRSMLGILLVLYHYERRRRQLIRPMGVDRVVCRRADVF